MFADSRVTQASIVAEYEDERITIESRADDSSMRKGKLIHTLAAHARIRDWEDGILAGDQSHQVNKV